eukprot:scaffold14267_cov55-Phaeocystis_antarctica.AAC.1
MALSKLSADEHRILFVQLCNVLEPRLAVYFSSASHELREPTQVLRQQLWADHEAAAALCDDLGMSCKGLREKTSVYLAHKGLSAADLATLGSLGSVLPACEELLIDERSCSLGGMRRLVAELGAGALPAVKHLYLGMHVGNAGASALAAALDRGALPRLKRLSLYSAAVGDAGLVALSPALRRLPALQRLSLVANPFGDEGLAALVAPSAGAQPPTGGLAKLEELFLRRTRVTDTGCATLASALENGALPALKERNLKVNQRGQSESLHIIPASAAAKEAVHAAFRNGTRKVDLAILN